MTTHRVKEVKKVRPSLKRYPAAAEFSLNENEKKRSSNGLDPLGIILLIGVISSLLVLPHLALAAIPADSIKGVSTQSQTPSKSVVWVRAHAGNSAWSLIQAVNQKTIDMQAALEKFKTLNGTTQIKQDISYQVPIMK